MSKEQINHPSHYLKDGKECIDCMIEEFGVNAVIAFCLGNEYKYKWRAGQKDGNPEEQDLRKAEWYREKAKELERINTTPRRLAEAIGQLEAFQKKIQDKDSYDWVGEILYDLRIVEREIK